MQMTPTATISIALPDKEALTKTFTQYGMRYPDGEVRWGKDHPVGQSPVDFELLLAERHPPTLTLWNTRLQRRAAAACINLSEYREGHESLKRTVIVVVADAEEL